MRPSAEAYRSEQIVQQLAGQIGSRDEKDNAMKYVICKERQHNSWY